MIYLDTSSLLKLFHEEPESAGVRQAVAAESEIMVSALTRLESRLQLKAGWLGGEYGKARYLAYVKELDQLAETDPFRFVDLAGGVFATAIRQDWVAVSLHVRTLDRLHLAAMEELDVRRLMTNDATQAVAAKALGWEVVVPL
jgi:predicted nucleic acid-binding protein